MTSTSISATFFTKANLCCYPNSLSTKHANAPNQAMFESLLLWTCYIHLIMTGNKKLGAKYDKQVGTILST